MSSGGPVRRSEATFAASGGARACRRREGRVGAVFLFRETVRLPRVEEIADEVGDGDAGEDAAIDERRREADDVEAERGDEEELDDVVEGDGAEAIGVAAGEELHAGAS